MDVGESIRKLIFGALSSQPLSRRKCDRKRPSSYKQTHILFIMVDYIGLMQVGIYTANGRWGKRRILIVLA